MKHLEDITISKTEAEELGIIDGLGLVHKDIYKSINKQILEMINSGEELPWRKPWRDGYKHKGISYGPQNYVTGSPYKGANAFTMWLYNLKNRTENIHFLTKKQVADRGGKLLPEAKPILVWAFIKTTETKVTKEGKEFDVDHVGIVSYFVYDLAHTEGVKPIKRKTIKVDEKHEVIASAELIIEHMPKRPKIDNNGGNRAFYSPTPDSISMPVKKAFKSMEEYYSTLFHELVHSTGHKKRLDRKFEQTNGNKKAYAFEELIAEMGAAYLCGVANIDYHTLKNSAAYLKGWASKLKTEIATDKTFLFRAILAATKAAKYIVGNTLEKYGEIVTEGKKTITKHKPAKNTNTPKDEPSKPNTSKEAGLPHATLLKIHWHEGTGEFENYQAKSWEDLQNKFERIYSHYKKSGGGGYDKVKVEIQWSNGKRIVDRADVGDGNGDFNPSKETIGEYLKRQKSVMYESNFNVGERDLVSWSDSSKATHKPNVKASATEAINQLLSLPKYKQYGAMFLGMFYSIFKNTDHVDTIEGKLKATLFKKHEFDLYEADRVDDDELTNVTLTDHGKDIIKGIQGRLDTLKAKKGGQDLFPELTGTKITKAEYGKLLSDYDKYTGIYEDTTDKKEIEDLKEKIKDIERKIHSYERDYELKGIVSKPSQIKFDTYTNDHGTFTSASYRLGTIFKRKDGTFYYKTGEWPKMTYNASTLKQAIAAIDKFSDKEEKQLGALTPALEFIKSYIALDGRTITMDELAMFIAQLQEAIRAKQIKKTDPYADSIREIQRKLVNAYNNNIHLRSIKIKINDKLKYEEELQGLGFVPEMIAAAAGALVQKVTRRHLNKEEKPLEGLGCSDNPNCGCNKRKPVSSKENSSVMSADKMGEVKYETFSFNPYYKGIFGAPATNFDMCIYGDPGTGKTVFLLKLAHYFAENFGPVLYVSTEEYGAATLIDKIKRFETNSKNLFFSPTLLDPKIDLKKYKFIFIDSVNHAKINLEQYKKIRSENPNTVFVLILQTTKAGSYRGGKDWPHEVEISMKLFKDENGKRMLNIDKDRYSDPRTVKI